MQIFSLRLAQVMLVSSLAFAAEGAMAKTCDVTIEANDAMQFNQKEMSVAKDCTEVKVTLKHTGKLPKSAMGHDWVLSAESDMQAIVTGGIQAGLAADYLPADKSKIIAHTKLIGGGESDSTTFKTSALKAGTTYKFFCTFPGHSGIMHGVFSVK